MVTAIGYSRRVLHLASETDRDWWSRQEGALDELLIDHAHCEAKAASTALGLIFRYPQHAALLGCLSALAQEELAHFDLVLGHLARRGVEYRRLPASAYASALMAAVRTGEPERLIDTLICCALIEARSCERMQIISEQATLKAADPALSAMYQDLLASEARHHATYLQLVRDCGLCDESSLRRRTEQLAAHEAQVVASARESGRMHG